MIILFKKGDTSLLENYLPISSLSPIYKVVSKIITNRFKNKPVVQAAFRKGFSTCDYLLTAEILIEKSIEYNFTLYITFPENMPDELLNYMSILTAFRLKGG